jgi:hypothetical protein
MPLTPDAFTPGAKLASMSSKDKVRLFPISTTLAAPSWAIRQAITQRMINLLFILAISKALESPTSVIVEILLELYS